MVQQRKGRRSRAALPLFIETRTLSVHAHRWLAAAAERATGQAAPAATTEPSAQFVDAGGGGEPVGQHTEPERRVVRVPVKPERRYGSNDRRTGDLAMPG